MSCQPPDFLMEFGQIIRFRSWCLYILECSLCQPQQTPHDSLLFVISHRILPSHYIFHIQKFHVTRLLFVYFLMKQIRTCIYSIGNQMVLPLELEKQYSQQILLLTFNWNELYALLCFIKSVRVVRKMMTVYKTKDQSNTKIEIKRINRWLPITSLIVHSQYWAGFWSALTKAELNGSAVYTFKIIKAQCKCCGNQCFETIELIKSQKYGWIFMEQL